MNSGHCRTFRRMVQPFEHYHAADALCGLKRRQRDENELTLGCRSRRFCAMRLWGHGLNDYDLLRDYLKKQKLPEFVLTFDQIEEIIEDALPRAAHRASWWETERSPQEKMPQREACLEAGYIATRQADGKSVKFKRMKTAR